MLMITECQKCKHPDRKNCSVKVEIKSELAKTNIRKKVLRYRCHEWLKFEKFTDLKIGDEIAFVVYHLNEEDGEWEESDGCFNGKITSALHGDKFYMVDAHKQRESIIRCNDNFHKYYYPAHNIAKDECFIIPVSFRNIMTVSGGKV